MARRFSLSALAVSLSAFSLAFAALLPRATAQCQTQWLPGPTSGGPDGLVRATTWWDPDGAGPLPALLAVGGEFRTAGSVVANGIALHDPVSGTWSTLGSGLQGTVVPGIGATIGALALTTAPNGDLVVGGTFSTAGGVPANNVARWNGTSWSALGAGTDATVRGVAALSNGDVIATGDFFGAGGVIANKIARWNGSVWSPLGTGLGTGGAGYGICVAALQNGDVVAGGNFSAAGGTSTNNIARWNGSTWSTLGSGLIWSGNETAVLVQSILPMPNGDLVVCGAFSHAGGISAANVARWNGTTWSALGTGLTAWTRTVVRLPNGDLVAGGVFSQFGSGGTSNRIAQWNGTTWSPLGTGTDNQVTALAVLPNADVLAFGMFDAAGGVAVERAARWDGAAWSAAFAPSTSTVGSVYTLLALAGGDVIVGGEFTRAGGISANNIARWDGVAWSPFGPGMNGPIYALAQLPNGTIIAGGNFTNAGGVMNHVARWNGGGWSILGSGVSNPVYSLAALPDGTFVAGGAFHVASWISVPGIARWNGANWVTVGSLPPFAGVAAMAPLPNGDLVAVGYAPVGSNVARWNGSVWSQLGPSIPWTLHAVTTLPNGDVVVGGSNYIARWNGTAWSPMAPYILGGLARVRALCTLPNGDLLAGGDFTNIGGVAVDNIARWDGTTWSPVGSGLAGPVSGEVRAVATLADGDVLAGGAFTIAGGVPSSHVARLTTSCPASTASYGVACAGSGGTNVLEAATLPWLGSTFRATATGMPASSLAVVVTGFSSIAIALPAILPQGVVGCTVLVSPDILDVVLPAAGVAQTQIVLPDAPSLVGVVVNHQVVPFEVDASLVLIAVTSTNALSLVLGSF